MKKFNYRHIALHCLAIFFIAFAFRVYAYLSNLELAELLRRAPNPQAALEQSGLYVVEVTSLQITIGLAHTLGLLVGFALSLVVSHKKSWYWMNSLLAALLVIGLSYWNISEKAFINAVLLSPGSWTNGLFYYLINASVTLLLGVALLFIIGPINRLYKDSVDKIHYA